MRTISDKAEFSLHFIILKEPITFSNLPENLDLFCTDSITDEPITISFRCNDEKWFDKILILSYKDSGFLNSLEKYSIDGIYGKSGGTELISEYLLSNFITDIDDPEYFHKSWVNTDGDELEIDIIGQIVVDGTTSDVRPPHHSDQSEFFFNNKLYSSKYVNNLTLAPDFRNLIQQREYPPIDYEDGSSYGRKRFQYNVNQENLKKWTNEHAIPDFIFEILSSEQKQLLSKRLSSYIQSSWDEILKDVLNQKFVTEKVLIKNKVTQDTWGYEMYSTLGGDGEENVYLSEGISIRPDGTLTED